MFWELMQWDDSTSAGFSHSTTLYSPVIDSPPYDYQTVNVEAQKADSGSLWQALRRMIQLRKEHSALGEGDFSWLECRADAILAFYRASDHERILAIHNLSPGPQEVNLNLPNPQPIWTDLLSGQSFPMAENNLHLILAPYQFHWLK
jgi:maltose alpha-D-glucosyltransferase/alpha-amylase